MGSQVTIVASQIDKQRLGYQAVSLTNFAATTEPQMVAGSKIEVGGALYEITSDESGTGWGGIGSSNDVYFYLVPSGSSSSWSYSTTAPTWDTAKQGWYNGLNRCFGGCYKDAGGNYANKWIAEGTQIPIGCDGKFIRCVPMSGYTPAKGDVVELNYDGTIRKALSNVATVLASGSIVSGAGGIVALTATTFLVTYSVGLVDYAVVGTVDERTLAISWGTPATIYTHPSTNSAYAVCALTSTLVLVAYGTGSGATQQYARTLSISGTSITVNAQATGPATALTNELIRMTDTSALLANRTTTTAMTVTVLTVSGTTVTFNTAASITTASNPVHVGLTVASDNLSGCLAYAVGGLFFVVFTISGTTVTLGSINAFTTTIGSTSGPMIEPIDGLCAVMMVENVSDAPWGAGIALYQRSSTSRNMNFYSSGCFVPTPATVSKSILALLAKSEGLIGIAASEYKPYTGSAATSYIVVHLMVMKGHGGAIDRGDVVYRDKSITMSAESMTMLPSSEIVLVELRANTASDSEILAIKRRNRIIGIAVDTSGTVQVNGVVHGLSGLTIGECGVSDAGAIIARNTSGSVKIGNAVSPTKLVLAIGGGV